jgi:hypothetical protein
MQQLNSSTTRFIFFFSILVLFCFLISGCTGKKSSKPVYDPPVLTSIDPDHGTVGTQITITGSNFSASAMVYFDTLRATNVQFVDNNTLLTYAPDGLVTDSFYHIRVSNPGSTFETLTDAFQAVEPDLVVINGATRPSGQVGSTVLLEGDAFGDIQGTGRVFFSDGAGSLVEAVIALPGDWVNTFVVTTVPSGTASGPVVIETATGVSDSIEFRVTSAAIFSPSTINWTQTTPLPNPLQGLIAVHLPVGNEISENVVYVLGGADGSVTPISDVWYGAIDASGHINSWVGTGFLPAPRAFATVVAATPFNSRVDTTVAGYIYLLGGIELQNDSTPVSTVLRGTVNLDKIISDWQSVASLPMPLHSSGATIFRGWLYLMGGATDSHQPVSEVWRAKIDSAGNLRPWESQTSLANECSYFGAGIFANFLYVVGGETAISEPADGDYTDNSTRVASILYNRLDVRTGQLSFPNWTQNASELIKAVSKHTAVIAGGNILVSAGLYNGAKNGSTEHQYAQIMNDGSTASFNGATGSSTIIASGGKNLFNHATISYVDPTGIAHIMVLAGNDVNSPTNPTNQVWFY